VLHQIRNLTISTAAEEHVGVEITQVVTSVSMFGIVAVETIETQHLHFLESHDFCNLRLWFWQTPSAHHVFKHFSLS